MAFVTIQEAANLTGKSRQTIYRHIRKGKLSRLSDAKIDTAELLRVYGAFKSDNVTCDNKKDRSMLQHETENETWLKSQIEKLQTELREQRAEFLEREKRLIALLENKSNNTGSIQSIWGSIFKNKLSN